jgi:hypothetical protein
MLLPGDVIDPYIIITLGSTTKTSAVIENGGPNTTWNNLNFEFGPDISREVLESELMHVEVWDRNTS